MSECCNTAPTAQAPPPFIGALTRNGRAPLSKKRFSRKNERERERGNQLRMFRALLCNCRLDLDLFYSFVSRSGSRIQRDGRDGAAGTRQGYDISLPLLLFFFFFSVNGALNIGRRRVKRRRDLPKDRELLRSKCNPFHVPMSIQHLTRR